MIKLVVISVVIGASLVGGGGATTPGQSICPANTVTANARLRMVAAYICRRVFTVNASWQEMQNFCITLEQLRFFLQEFPGLRKIPAQFPGIFPLHSV